MGVDFYVNLVIGNLVDLNDIYPENKGVICDHFEANEIDECPVHKLLKKSEKIKSMKFCSECGEETNKHTRILNPILVPYNDNGEDEPQIDGLTVQMDDKKYWLDVYPYNAAGGAMWEKANDIKDAYVFGSSVLSADADYDPVSTNLNEITETIESTRKVLEMLGLYRPESFKIWLIPSVSY